MAAIYTRIYTYTGQVSWTPNERSVPFSSFVASGDTNRTIGQIVSIQYEHYHSAGSSNNWTLTGRLVLSDGTTVDSNSITQRISKSTVVLFTNTFATTPTVEQFASIKNVQTLDTDGSAANNGNLSWRADSAKCPMRLIVKFYEQVPTKYAPQITNFTVERVNSSNQATLEGTYISTTLKLSLASGAPTSTANLTLYTSTSPDSTGTATDLTSKISSLLTGVTLNTTIITGQYDVGTTYYFTLVFSIGSEMATAAAQAFRAKAPIHITNDGVSFGGFSSATPSDPREEFHNRAIFHKGFSVGSGIDVLTNIGIQHGSVTSRSFAGNNALTDITVTFSKAFSSVPNVVTTFDSANVDMSGGYRWDYLTLTVMNITKTGFTIRVKNGTSELTAGIQWIAIGLPA